MICMRQFSDEFRLRGRSLVEIWERYGTAVTRHQSIGRVKFHGKKITAEALTNAAVMAFLDMDEREQERLLAAYIPRIEALQLGELEPAAQASPPAEVEADRTERLADDKVSGVFMGGKRVGEAVPRVPGDPTLPKDPPAEEGRRSRRSRG